MVHARRLGAVLLLLSAARGDVAVPKEGPVLRGLAKVDERRGVLVIDGQERPLSGFLLVERTDASLLWAPDVESRVEGYRRLVYEGRRARLVELAKEAVRARDAATARRLYAWAKREGLDGKEERIVRKRVENLEKSPGRLNEARAAPVREEADRLEGELPALLVERARRESGAGALLLVRAALRAAPGHAPSLELLGEHAPAAHPFPDARAWLDWRLDLEARGFRLRPADDPDLKRAQHYWRPDLLAIEGREVLLVTALRDLDVLRTLLLRSEAALGKLRELFATDEPLARAAGPLPFHLFIHEENFNARRGNPVVNVLPPYFLWDHTRWDLKEDVTRCFWPPASKDRQQVLYTAVHELVRHWLWSRNPRYSSAQLMAVGHETAGYWAEVGLAGLLAEGEYDLDGGTVDLAAAGAASRKTVLEQQAHLIAWNRFFLMDREEVHLLNRKERTPEGYALSYLFARQATVLCHYLYNAEGGKYRQRLADFVVDQALGRQAELAPAKAFGLTAQELGNAVLVSLLPPNR